MKYDIICVGAGLTSAIICEQLKHKYKIAVFDVRSHIAGNCYDYNVDGKYISQYGPHIYHTAGGEDFKLLSKYTSWIPYTHKICAEIESGLIVPFPYSKETEKFTGKLTEQEIIDTFFKPYSKKMWKVDWDVLPSYIKGRVPKNTNETSDYFPGQQTYIPVNGFTNIFKQMFDGVDMFLNTSETEWSNHTASHIFYCGRPDRIKVNGTYIGDTLGWLDFRSVKFDFKKEDWQYTTTTLNYCHMKVDYTRKSNFGPLTCYETPYIPSSDEMNPTHPFNTLDNLQKYDIIKKEVLKYYPNITLAGRNGLNSYMDMSPAILRILKILKEMCLTSN